MNSLRILSVACVCALAISAARLPAQPSASDQLDLAPLPPAGKRVSDLAGLLSAADSAALEELSADLEARKGSQLAIVLMQSTAPESIEEYTLRLAEAWQIGRAGADDGVILLAAIQDRRVRIEVGYGLEGAIPDAIAARIIATEIRPRFRNGEFGPGLRAAAQAIIARIDPEALPPALQQPETERTWSGALRNFADEYYIPYIFWVIGIGGLLGLWYKSVPLGLLLPFLLIFPVALAMAIFIHIEHLVMAAAIFVCGGLFFAVLIDRRIHGWRRGSSGSSYSGSSSGYSSSSSSSYSSSSSSSSSFSGGGGSFGGGGASGSW